eukprot:10752426-Heterocapsa_arctica.AAC.1
MLERACEANSWPLKLRCRASVLAFCEDYNGDSEDARRPLKNLQTPVKTFKPLVHLCECSCGARCAPLVGRCVRSGPT